MDKGPKQEHKVLRVPHLFHGEKGLENKLDDLVKDGWRVVGTLEEQNSHIILFYREVWPPPSKEEKEAYEMEEIEGKARRDILEKTMIKNLELMERLEKRGRDI